MKLADYEAAEYEGWLDETASQQPDPEPEQAEEGAIRAPRTLVRAASDYRAEAPARDPNQLELPLGDRCCDCSDHLRAGGAGGAGQCAWCASELGEVA